MSMTVPSTEPAARETIVVSLPEGEQERVVEALLEAGFAVLEARGAADFAELSTLQETFRIVVVDASAAPRPTVEAIAELRRHGCRFTTLYVADGHAFDEVERAGITGSDELALRPIGGESIRWRVEAMVVRSSAEVEGGEVDSAVAGQALHQLNVGSPILAIFNPKGGVGKTTIATNLAAVLQIRKGKRVLLVDADTVTGHVALSLGIRNPRGIADTWGEQEPGDAREPILNLATEHSSGIKVATLTVDPLALPHLNADRVGDMLLEARTGVDVVIVDLHPSYGDVNLAIFAASTRILVPVTPDLPALRAALQLSRVAKELGVHDRLSLIVNRANSGVSVHDIEETTSLTAIAEIRSAGMLLVRAGNLGKTLVEQFPREKVTGDFDKLADKVLTLVGATGSERAPAPVPARRLSALLGSKVGASS